MLSIAAKTKLTVAEVADRADEFFIKGYGMVLIERVMHLHGTEGAVDLSVTGETLVSDKPRGARMVLDSLTDHVQREYRLNPVYLMIHLHASEQDEVAHLLMQINYGQPVEVNIETREFEIPTKEFIANLPK